MFNGFDSDEVYDLAADPDELHNLANDGSYRAQVNEMRDRLYAMMDRVGDPYGAGGMTARGGERPNRYGAQRYLPRLNRA